MPYQFSQKKFQIASNNDPHAPTINAVVQQVTQELKQILKRDFNKKMVENTAFKKFELWWEEESTKQDRNTASVKGETPADKPTQNKDINILLEANRENLYSNINIDNLGLGLGFRASLPKMPSFRRKKMSAPIVEDDDSRKLSDNEEIIQHSDAEDSTKLSQRIDKTLSSSSSSSESSIFSSSNESSDEDDSSSEVEEEVKQLNRRRRSTTPQDRLTPIPTAEDSISPIKDEAEVGNQILENQKIDNKEKKIEYKSEMYSVIEPCYNKYLDSDQDMSDEERKYLERRKRNTEYMEQIEKERMERESRERSKNMRISPVKEEENLTTTNSLKDTQNFVQTDIDNKLMYCNPEPPDDVQSEPVTYKSLEKNQSSSDEENLEIRRKKALKESQIPNGTFENAVGLSESSDGGSSTPKSQVALEHSYCMPFQKQTIESTENIQHTFAHDHGYTNKEEIKEKPARQRKSKDNSKKNKKLQNALSLNEECKQIVKLTTVHTIKHKERDMVTEMGILYEFLTKGIDTEDIGYVKTSYEAMLADDAIGYWLNDTHWVDHCITDLYSSPPKKRKRDDVRVHVTGCARTEGFYKLEAVEKAKYKYHHTRSYANTSPDFPVTKAQGTDRFNIFKIHISCLIKIFRII